MECDSVREPRQSHSAGAMLRPTPGATGPGEAAFVRHGLRDDKPSERPEAAAMTSSTAPGAHANRPDANEDREPVEGGDSRPDAVETAGDERERTDEELPADAVAATPDPALPRLDAEMAGIDADQTWAEGTVSLEDIDSEQMAASALPGADGTRAIERAVASDAASARMISLPRHALLQADVVLSDGRESGVYSSGGHDSQGDMAALVRQQAGSGGQAPDSGIKTASLIGLANMSGAAATALSALKLGEFASQAQDDIGIDLQDGMPVGWHSLPFAAGHAASLHAPHGPGASPEVITRQLAEAVVHMRDDRVEIALSPEELGTVRMTLTRGESGGSLTVWVDRPEVLEMLRRNADLMLEDLKESGLQDMQLEFRAGADRDRDGQGHDDGDERGDRVGVVMDAHGTGAAEAGLAIRPEGLDRWRVDIRV